MLQVINLEFDYQDKPLLQQVSFQVAKGDLLHIKGANGSGKTTLIKLIAGLCQPASGQIHFNGLDIHTNLCDYHKKLCFVGHKSGVNPYLTIKENCLFDLHYRAQHIEELASIFNLVPHLDKLCGLLSAGQCRQVGLLRLWMTNAPLWLLDEPLVALDEKSLLILMAKIEEHRTKGGMVIMSSHQQLPTQTSKYQEYLL